MIKDHKAYAFGRPDEIITEDSIRDVYGVESHIIDTDEGRFILPIKPFNLEGDDD